MRISSCVAILLTFLFLLPAAGAAETAVKAWEETITIPTYEVGPNNLNPAFYDGRRYQGAKGQIYPYPLMDNLTDKKVDKDYTGVYIENEYVRLMVVPELGGRIFEAVDKTNGYNFFYRQHVIKPALIGMVGAWISGGVEWNIPHHHRASSFMPVDYTVTKDQDGSKTIWVGEIERRHRLKWMVGLTLRPGKSYVEATVKLFNRTQLPHSFLYFANVAVHTNADYQVIFPPSTKFATHHSKVQFSKWPISDSIYGGADFRDGVDVSMYKNHPTPNSMFAWNYIDDFLAGYDHGKEAGTMHVADHNLVVGKKFFSWGNSPAGKLWDGLLTDTDGPYLELMVGAWSDNQPDYSWAQPYELKEIKQYWYPFRDIGGAKNANIDAAVNLDVEGGSASVGFYTTTGHSQATAALMLNGKSLLSEEISISPGQPFVKSVTLPAGTKPEELTATLTTGDRTLVEYRPDAPSDPPMPPTATPPPAPEDIKTNEELLLAGLRLEQFYNPQAEPYPYYEEALKRDPGDYRVNTQLAINYLKRAMYEEAEEHLRRAVERISHNYTRPKDTEAHYFLGVALRAQGKLAEAEDLFERAAWSYAWTSASYLQLAEMACVKKDFAAAISYIDRSLATNDRNTRGLSLRSAILRQLNRNEEAAEAAEKAAVHDPLGAFAAAELYRLMLDDRRNWTADIMLAALREMARGDVQNYLELATDYAAAGFWGDSVALIDGCLENCTEPGKNNPMLHYYRGFYLEKLGRADEAKAAYRNAAAAPPDYCFPHRMEGVEVLNRAMEVNPRDSRAPYYLGNLLFDSQPEVARDAYAKSVKLSPDFSIAYRNLGLALAKTSADPGPAIGALEKSISLKPDARALIELDDLYQSAGRSTEERLAGLEKNQKAVVERDDVLAREIELLVEVGRYDEALQLLSGRHFRKWEGVGSVHVSYMDAHLLRGHQQFAAKDYSGALKDYEAALEFPALLEAAKGYRDGVHARPLYYLGLAHKAAGDSAEARGYFEKTIAEADDAFKSARPSLRNAGTVLYYKGLALDGLGRKSEAAAVFAQMIEIGGRTLKSGGEVDYYAKFGQRGGQNSRLAQAHYVVGLGQEGIGKDSQAKKEFQAALKLDPGHAGAGRKVE
jgi:tetratricopeptide (TPR) repeat protein